MAHRASDPPDGAEPWRQRIDARDAYAIALEARTLARANERRIADHASTIGTLEDRYHALREGHVLAERADLDADTWRADHEQRLRSLERWRYALPLTALSSGVAAVASVVAALIAAGG